jgi:hypothetical protein
MPTLVQSHAFPNGGIVQQVTSPAAALHSRTVKMREPLATKMDCPGWTNVANDEYEHASFGALPSKEQFNVNTRVWSFFRLIFLTTFAKNPEQISGPLVSIKTASKK